jgi:hypothetical protein
MCYDYEDTALRRCRLVSSSVSSLQMHVVTYRGADKSIALPGWKQATATEDFDFHISYL